MPQRQCPWCHRLGAQFDEHRIECEEAAPHADGSKCVCRHVTCHTRRSALREGGRYFDGRWRCFGCGTTTATVAELNEIRDEADEPS